MDNLMIAFIVLLIFSFVSRTINANANKKLDKDKKVELIDLFSQSRILTFVILIAIIIIFYLSIKFRLADPTLVFVLYSIAVLVFILATSYQSYKKLKVNNFPESYINAYILSTALRFLGIVIFIALLKI